MPFPEKTPYIDLISIDEVTVKRSHGMRLEVHFTGKIGWIEWEEHLATDVHDPRREDIVENHIQRSAMQLR